MANDLTGKTLGRYQIMERLGRGGMADVYRAYQPSMDRYVAVKVMHGHLTEDESFITRFKREAQSVGTLRHPNIVQVIDFDIEGDQYFMVMEYIKGDTLKAYLSRTGALSIDDAVDIAIKLADAMAYAHGQGLIHRDIKPANILMPSPSTPIVTDFGIARIMDATGLTSSGISIGTPAYMSPEAGRGEKVDERGDIYSLGIVLYEMLTGTIPYDADTPYAVILKHINDPLPMPRQFVVSIPDAVERIVLKALAKNPSDRFQSARDMKTALENAQASLVTALPTRPFPSASASDQQTVASSGARPQMSPWIAGIAALAVVAVIGFVVLSTANRPAAPLAGAQVATIVPTQQQAIVSTTASTTSAATAPTVLAGAATQQATVVSNTPIVLPTVNAPTTAPTTAPTVPTAIATQPAVSASLVDPKYAELYKSVRQAMIDGSSITLIPKVEQALQSDPQSYDLLVLHAGLEISAGNDGDPEKALAEAQSAVKLNADRPEAYMVLGIYYFVIDTPTSDERIANLKQSTGYLAQAVQKGSQDYYAYWFSAKANKALKDYVGPDNNVPLAKLDEFFERAASLAPADFRFFMERGEHYADQRQNEQAQHSFEQALKIQPHSPEAEGELAAVLLLQKQGDKALALYVDGLTKANINDPRYIADAAFVARANGQSEKASEWGKLALALEPNTPAASYILGLLASDNNDYKQAIAYLDQAAKAERYTYEYPFLNRNFDRNLQADRGRVLVALNRLDDAENAYTAVLSEIDDWLALYLERARLYILLKDTDKARADLRRALQLATENNDTASQKEIVDLLKKVGPGAPGDEEETPTSTP